jgi:hypothetical protein
MIVLWNRAQHIEGGFEWLDWATHQHVHRRHSEREYGPFTGGHFDGSTGRTLCLHMMLCSGGVRAVPFAEGLRLGAVEKEGELFLMLEADATWRVRLCFDGPRAEHKGATINWARINEMPRWFVVRPERKYTVVLDSGEPAIVAGERLIRGLQVALGPKGLRRIRVTPASGK